MIVLVGGDSTANRGLKKLLEEDRPGTAHIADHRQALKLLSLKSPQALVLDCQEYGALDLTFCQEIRSLYSGLFFILADPEHNHFQNFALSIGVDASFSKSANLLVTAANIKSLLRRFAPSEEAVTQLTFGSLSIDPGRRDAFIRDQAANLSTIEFDIFWYLAQKSGCVVSRDEIHRKIYNAEYNGYDRSIDLYVSRIRQKIGDQLTSPHYLKTVRGVGYQFIGGSERVSN